ncbi:hypothetical protein NMG60_11003341 [Bertholletia excelsa]
MSFNKEEAQAQVRTAADKYRSLLADESQNTQWRHGGPPIFDAVNKLFEEGRTKMELSHKTRLEDFKTMNPEKFKLIVNGREGLSAEETLRVGSYNALLKTSLPEEFKYYKAEEESFDSSHDAFRSAFPRGFAWEVIGVYSGPPVIAYKFRHWGFFEGPFKGHAPTGEMVEFYGMGLLKVDESLRAEDVEIYYDPGELFSGLLKGPPVAQLEAEDNKSHPTSTANPSHCPFHK